MRYISFLLLFLCSACVAPSFHTIKVNTFEEEKKIAVKVSVLDIISKVERFERLPHIENEISISPETVLKKWIRNRFYPISLNSKTEMKVIIEKAYLTKTDEISDKWYIFDNEKYTLTYELKFVFEKEGRVLYTHNIGGYETSSLPKRSSLTTKEEVFERMLNMMVYKIDEKVRVQLPQKFIVSD